jgi:hypothetical protein
MDMEKYGDATIYFVMGAIATLLFIIRLMLALFLGNDGGDFDVADGGGHFDGATDASFSLFSILSITAFFMGTGWMGLACRHDWGMSGPKSLLSAVGFGVVMMVGSAYMMSFVRKLSQEKSYDVRTAVNTSGQVYLTIPAKGEGRGQVEVNVSGRRKVMFAVTTGEEIAAFTAIVVVDTEDDGTLVVEAKEA